jgi:hypothetical protein
MARGAPPEKRLSSWLEGVPGAIGTSPERMVRNSRL